MREKFSKTGSVTVDEYTATEVTAAGDPAVGTAVKLRLVWEHRQLLLRLAIAGFLVFLLIAFLIPKRYQSITRLMPPDQSNSSMAMLTAALGGRSGGSGSSTTGSSLGSVAGDLLGVKSTGDLFIGILHSRTVQDALIAKFDLQRVYWDRYLEDARDDLDAKSDVTAERKSGIITIKVTDKDPRRAAAMAREYVEQLNRVVTHVNTSSAQRERVFLEDRLVHVSEDLQNAEKAFSEFASKNTALDIPTQGKAMIEASAAIEGQLILAQTELQSLSQIYSDQNVRVRSMRARVAELQRQSEKIGGKFDGSTDAKNVAEQSMYPSIRKLPLLGVTYADMYRNTKIQEAIFGTLTQEYELAKVQEAKETPSVKIIDPPDVPGKKSFPPRFLIALAGSILCVSAGIGWIFFMSSWARTDPQDPGKVLAQEIFDSVKLLAPVGAMNGQTETGSNGSLWRRVTGRKSDLSNSKEHAGQKG